MSDKGRPADEPDLGALIVRILPRLIALEEPILAEAGLSMWEYAIVTELATSDVVSQVELSRRTRRDPTRLGRHLDELEARGLIVRERADDQRLRTVRLTDHGRGVFKKVKLRVRAAEDEFLLAAFSAREAGDLRRLLIQLADS